MTLDRRTFLGASLAGGALVACTRGAGSGPSSPPAPKLKLLILGGTSFLGPEIVSALRARGHTMTLFNRGKTNPGLFPDVEKLQGDRDGKLQALEGRKWDAVIDTSGYVPRIVKMSAELLAPSVGQYVFISTISVYKGTTTPGGDESLPVETLPAGAEHSEEVRQFYGALKALSEKAAEAAMPGRATSIRPGLIVGPGDPTDRFTYWPVRADRGGEMVAPGDGSDPVQVIDVRDLAEWIVEVVERRHFGTFTATGPAQRMTMRELIAAATAASASPATPVWMPWPFLEKQEVSPWADMPCWIPDGELGGLRELSNKAALAHGLRFRPIAETARDTLAWWKTLPEERRARPMKNGLPPEREQKVLAAFRSGG